MIRRVLICGARLWTDEACIARFVGELPAGTFVMHGDCDGADKIGGAAAMRRGLPVAAVRAPWQFAGRRAGPMRNQWMLDYLTPTEVHAFHDDLASSRGTADMKARAERRGLPFTLHSHSADISP